MIYLDSKHPPGTVAYFTAWHPRYWDFLDCFQPLQVPKGTGIMRAQTGGSAMGCNALMENFQGEWIWLLPDDHTWKPDILIRLLDRDVDVVAPMVTMRGYPYSSVGFKKVVMPDGCVRWQWEEIGRAKKEEKMLPCEGIGGAGMLVRRRVLDKIDQPYFTTNLPAGVSDDIDFSYRLFQKGAEIWLDPSVSLTHLVDAAIEPEFGPDGKKMGMAIHLMGKKYWVDEWADGELK